MCVCVRLFPFISCSTMRVDGEKKSNGLGKATARLMAIEDK